jgi:CubicO group peptidase (beta-lactamase class C family)
MVNGYGQYRRLGSLVVSAQSAPSIFSNGLAGAGAIRSSTKDMMIYLKNSMKDYKNSVFQEAKYTSLLSEKAKVNLGWIVVDMPGKLGESIIAHDGATSGFRSYLGFVESEDIGVIILANGTRSVTSLGKNILQILAKESKKSASIANL